MNIHHNPEKVFPTVGNYTHGLEVAPNSRWLYISGQIPTGPDGTIPASFEEQCRAVWQNIEAVLLAAGMNVANLVKITTFLTDRSQVEINGAIRRQYLGELRPALTVIIAQTLDSQWLLEIEAIAATSA